MPRVRNEESPSPLRIGALGGPLTDFAALYLLGRAGVPVRLAHVLSLLLATALFYWLQTRREGHSAAQPGIPTVGDYAAAVLLALALRAGILVWLMQTTQGLDVATLLTAVLTTHLLIHGFAWAGLRIRPGAVDGEAAFAPRLTISLILYAIVLRLVYLGLPELFHQEAYYWNYSQHLDIGYLDHPPLMAWLIRLCTSALGHSEIAVRCAAFFAWLVGAYYVYRLSARLFDRVTAMGALLLFAALPGYFGAGFAMFPDAPLVACWAGGLYFLYRALIDQTRAAWFGVGLFVGLGMLTKYTIVLLGLAGFVFLLVDAQARRWFGRRDPYLAVALAVLVFSPAIVWNAQNDWASFVFQGPRRAMAQYEFALPQFLGAVLVLLTPTGVVATAAIFRSRPELLAGAPCVNAGVADTHESARRRGLRLLLCSVFVPVAVFFFFSLFRETKLSWTLPAWLGVLPFLSRLMVTVPTTRDPDRLRVWAHTLWRPTLIVLLIVYGLVLQHLVLGLPGLPYPKGKLGLGWADLAARIESVVRAVEAETGVRPLVVGMSPDSMNSWLAFYRSRAMAESSATENTGAAAWETAGPHLFGSESHMYRFWFPADAQAGRPMVLFGRTPTHVQSSRVDPCFRRGTPPEEILSYKNGRVTGRFYYRVVYGYSPHAVGCDWE